MAIYNTYFSVLGLQDSLGVLPNLGVLPGLGRLDDLGEYAFSPASLFLNGEQGVWYDPSDLTPEKVSWRRNLLTYSQDFENAAWTKSNASILSNLLLYSQEFGTSPWVLGGTATVTSNTTTAPDGTTTADTLSFPASSNTIYQQSAAALAGVTYTMSVWLRADSPGTIRIAFANDGTKGVDVSVTTSWTRFTYTNTTAAGNDGMQIRRDSAGQLSAVYAWGAQLVPGSTAQTYTRSLATAAPIQFADPLGGTLADKLVENTATSTHLARTNVTVVAGVQYVFSCYAKAAERQYLNIAEDGTTGWRASFDLTNGTVAGSAGTTSATIEAAGSGWYRCAIQVRPTGTGGGIALAISNTSTPVTPGPSYTGDGVSGIYVYGAQVEQASTASAYQRITDFSSDFLAAFPTHALYQESTGVTPVTALGQSVGLVLDKRLGGMAALGSELISNGDFSSGTTGWTLSGAGAIQQAVNGRLEIIRGSVSTSSSQSFTTVVGRTYRVLCDVVGFSSASPVVRIGTTIGGSEVASFTYTTTGTKQFTFVATATTSWMNLFSPGAQGDVVIYDNISVREVPGNHAIQATSAARPTLQARSNLLVRTEQFDNASWTVKVNPVYGVTDPNGGTAAVRVTSNAINQIVLRQDNYTIVSGGNYTHRVAIRRVSGTGTIFLTTSNNVNVDITSQVSSAWQYVTVASVNPLASGANGFFLFYLGTSGDSIEVAFPSAVFTSDADRPYQRVTTATDYADVGLPRNLTFDGIDDSLATAGNVDFATWTVGTRRNLLTVPTMFDDAAWGVAGLTRTANTTIAPDGTQTGDTITGNSASNAVIFPNAGVSASATNYTFSVYLNLGTASFAVVSLWSGVGTNGVNVWVNGSTGALTGSTNTTAGYTLVSSSSTAVGGGWYRIAVTGTVPAATLFVSVRLVDTDNAFVYTNTSGKTLNLWGAQLEVGSTATAFQDVGTDKVTTFTGLFKNSNSSTQMVFETSANANSNNGTMYLTAQEGGTPQTMTFQSRGTIGAFASTAAVAYLAPTRRVVTGLGAIESDNATLRIDGVQVNVATNDQGTGTFGSYLLYVGRRGGTTLPFNGGLFQLVIRGAATDSVTVGNAERWVGQLTGVAL